MASQSPPTLNDILLDNSPAPWTLAAFMAYLSQNHCMETLEFTLDLQRYAQFHDEYMSVDPTDKESHERACTLWERLIQVYIVPCAPREINIPSRVRDRLLAMAGPDPPHPSELNEAGRIIYELMNDSLLVPFLESITVTQPDTTEDKRASRSPRSSSLLATSRSLRNHARSITAPFTVADSEGLTDDSEVNSPTTAEPMTPPTTPPTSDWGGLASSPGGLQRAIAAHTKGWKRVGARLGFNRKSSRGPSSSSSDLNQSRRSSGQSSS
ncbi:hypothetical protein VHEMI07851 [[Torrubiella] hemipterigena]|uniref:RGS domain-containing protein n=1 Tax=[Torrubiella] hemipterigena TaxID=1531966 RepID=A0A0A1TNQ5_9HYPO|nr:hypothetical protein VHEMI07851 [[Torrubiella] hemipterigena]